LSFATVDDPGRTNPEFARVTRGTATGIALVGQAIAILVQAIAPFRHRITGVRRTHQIAIGSAEASAFTPTCADAHRTWRARAFGFVDHPVAIVVKVVARFDFGFDLGQTDEDAEVTGRDAGVAHPQKIRLASRPTTGIILVDGAIAIVVYPVTPLITDGPGNGVTNHLPFGSTYETTLASARTHATQTGLPHPGGFVEQPIAVIVHVIARLFQGVPQASADQDAFHAIDGPLEADASLAGLTIVPAVRVALVHLAIAIIVGAVTSLDIRFPRLRRAEHFAF
jgi:hypothetical protein